MPTKKRRHASGVIADLLARPQAYDLFQAVRLLERWLSSPGESGLKRLSFINSMSLAFPVGDIERLNVYRQPLDVVDPMADDAVDGSAVPAAQVVEKVEVTTPAMGLLGVSGALPLYYTEALLQFQQQHRDDAARAFMDVFSHRAVLLFYEAWRKSRLALQYERGRDHVFMPMLWSMAGVGSVAARKQWQGEQAHSAADQALAYHAGQLQQRTVSAGQLQQVLVAQFRVPLAIEQFAGGWYALPPESRFHLGQAGPGAGASGAGLLGRSAMLGERMWQRDLRVRLILGPLRRVEFLRFLPGGPGATALRRVLLLMLGPCLDHEVRLRLDARDVASCTLHAHRPSEQGRLGWDTFLVSKPSDTARDDVRYTIDFST